MQSYRVKGIHVQGFGRDDEEHLKYNRAQCLSTVVSRIKHSIKKKVTLTPHYKVFGIYVFVLGRWYGGSRHQELNQSFI